MLNHLVEVDVHHLPRGATREEARVGGVEKVGDLAPIGKPLRLGLGELGLVA